jgi:nucleoside-diphosphate-sugar epimerase
MRIAITGSTSSIGNHLVNRLTLAGYDVIPLGGRSSDLWKLGMKFPEFLEADFLLHLAHDRTLTLKENVNATDLLVSSFQGGKIFLSSLSAHTSAKSIYGKSKYESEKLFLAHGGKVIRAGLVFGPNVGGMYLTLKKMTRAFPIIPVPYSGAPRLYMTHIDDLCDELIDLISRAERGVVLGAHCWPITLSDFIRRVRKQTSTHSFIVLVPIPRSILEIIRKILSPLKLRISLLDSLASLSTQINSEEFSNLVPPSKDFRIF